MLVNSIRVTIDQYNIVSSLMNSSKSNSALLITLQKIKSRIIIKNNNWLTLVVIKGSITQLSKAKLVHMQRVRSWRVIRLF